MIKFLRFTCNMLIGITSPIWIFFVFIAICIDEIKSRGLKGFYNEASENWQW